MPFFSIIIPSYNRAYILPRTLASVQAQTFADWECIIVDDGSSDNTKECIASYTDPRIKYIYQNNSERSAARNNGIHHAMCKYICFLDSDDEYLPNHLEVLYTCIIENNNLPSFYFTGFAKEKYNRNFTEFFWRNPIIPAQMCMHASIFNTYLFIPGIEIFEDMALCMELSLEFPILGISEQTVIYNKDVHSSTWVTNNSYKTMYIATQKFFALKPHIKTHISKKIYNEVLSEIYFGIVKYGVLSKKNRIVFRYSLQSIMQNIFHRQNKHRLYIFILCLFGNFTKAKKSLQL